MGSGAQQVDHAPVRPREEFIRAAAYGLGFDLVGFAELGPPSSSSAEHFLIWLESGHDADMAYLARGREKRLDSRLPFPGASHAVVVAMNYGGSAPSGPIARYARGPDYHEVMLGRLRTLHSSINDLEGRLIAGKAYVDTGPILERDLARRAGLGWFGKNSNLINPDVGSFFFLGALLLDLQLEVSDEFNSEHCGTCTRCIEACPTDAIVGDGVIDSRRCISFQTIENRHGIPENLRPLLGDLLYGCDICQDVCPWNVKFSRPLSVEALGEFDWVRSLDASDFLAMTQEEFSTRLTGSPMKRAKRSGLARNAAVVLGNRGDESNVAVLGRALRHDPSPVVREHCAWALHRIGGSQATALLQAAVEEEQEGSVLAALQRALIPG